ncbi:MAG: hypothetical protein LBU26_01625 [Synergistaceae bacterium]|jgi:murein biosynthesis integral membrane protein MurJ|nr:hypothetical protein [Synergistaceae bacterium]
MSRITSVKSPRGVSFALAAISLASKPLGYARTLLIAWAFGTSAGMDAYHLASGIIALFAGSVGNTLENAVLPELVRLRENPGESETCRSTAAFVSCFVMALTVLFIIALMTAPGILIRFFARGFDGERIITGARMLWWLLPFASVVMYKPTLDIWANVRERYTLSPMIATVFNFIAIPAILISIPFIGIYSIAFSMSAGHCAVFVLFLAAMRGAPLRWRARDVAWDSVRRICANSAYLVIILAAGTLYTVVDRYYASVLPVGSVAAISYAATLIGLLTMLAGTPMTYFLSLITKSAETDRTESLETVKRAISVALAYFTPISAFIAASAGSIVSLVFGWGSFGADSVSMTSICMSAYSIGFACSVAVGVMYRYAMAVGKLRTVTVMTYFLVALNAALDRAFVYRWGLLGLTAATSVTQIASFVIYYNVIIDKSLARFLADAKFFAQLAASAALAFCASLASAYGTAASLSASAALFAVYLCLAERLGLMASVPPGWHPSQFLAFVVNAIKSYANVK